MSKFKLISIRLTEEELKAIQKYREENRIDIAVFVREIIKELLLQDYRDTKQVLIETHNKYLSKSHSVRDKNFKIRLDAFTGEIFKEICNENNVSYTSVIRGFIFDEIYS